MNLLGSIFGAGVQLRNHLYDRGILRSRRLAGPVVSVGNLSVGGSGKTPFVLLLGELLRAREVRFDILSRGYGRKTKGVLLVDPAGSSHDFGDEPLLLARRLAVPVIVGEDRYQAGLFAEKRFGPQLHLLDDGFQHRSLARDFDIVLITPEDTRDSMLPGGRLREPPRSLARADAIVLAVFVELAVVDAQRLVLVERIRDICVEIQAVVLRADVGRPGHQALRSGGVQVRLNEAPVESAVHGHRQPVRNHRAVPSEIHALVARRTFRRNERTLAIQCTIGKVVAGVHSERTDPGLRDNVDADAAGEVILSGELIARNVNRFDL